MERLTITRTRRWGNSEIQINNVYSAARSKVKMDQVISMANDMITIIKIIIQINKNLLELVVITVIFLRLNNSLLSW